MKVTSLSTAILPVLVVFFCIANYVWGNEVAFLVRLTTGVLLVVAVLWRHLRIAPKSMFRWVYQQFHREGSAKSTIWFAVAYTGGLACMIRAFGAIDYLVGTLHLDADDNDAVTVVGGFLALIALPVAVPAVSIWATSRRKMVTPTAASMIAVYAAVGSIYFAIVTRNGGWKEEALFSSVIGTHGVLILILVAVVAWRNRHRSQSSHPIIDTPATHS